ncbi:MAG: substrate-binding domain-containing protein, partial [Eudoraea sp.]|uniref:substrate-binding domain-containing protein n=1 Tax=Eudoraea sp. TaxID=1979955 RepID=UPI003C772256
MPNWNFKVLLHNKLQIEKKLVFNLIGIALIALVYACAGVNEPSKITIAAAANTQYALESIIEKFTEKTGIGCELVIGSSGKHTAQIIEGAPFDIFVSADMKYPSDLFKKGLTTAAPEIYA